jgi:hypothetical protein
MFRPLLIFAVPAIAYGLLWLYAATSSTDVTTHRLFHKLHILYWPGNPTRVTAWTAALFYLLIGSLLAILSLLR